MRYITSVLGRLFLLFTLVPVVDLYLLIRIGEHLGGLATLALVVVTGMLGAALARAEGRRVIRAWQDAVSAGRVPTDGVVSGALVLAGGLLLVTPGVLTDALGLALLVPAVRRRIATYLTRRVQRAIERGSIHVVTARGFSVRTGSIDPRGNGVIDVEGETVSGPSARGRLDAEAPHD